MGWFDIVSLFFSVLNLAFFQGETPQKRCKFTNKMSEMQLFCNKNIKIRLKDDYFLKITRIFAPIFAIKQLITLQKSKLNE